MSQERSSSDPKAGIRWGWIVAGLIAVFICLSIFMGKNEGSVQYYMTVSEYLDRQPKYEGKKIKLAGRVQLNSLKSKAGNYDFVVEDLGREISVSYSGMAPDTFKEGSEVVVEGLGSKDAHFVATGLMAKCASKYKAGDLPPLEQMRGKSIY